MALDYKYTTYQPSTNSNIDPIKKKLNEVTNTTGFQALQSMNTPRPVQGPQTSSQYIKSEPNVNGFSALSSVPNATGSTSYTSNPTTTSNSQTTNTAPTDPMADLKNQIAEINKKLTNSQDANNAYAEQVKTLTGQLPTRDFDSEAKYLQDAKNAQLQALQASINRAKQSVISKQNQIIQKAPEEYQVYRNQADVQGAQNVQALKNILANLGQSKGGFGLTAMAKANANTANQIGAFNKQQQDTINTANQAISDAEAAAGFDEIQSAQSLSANLMNQLANLKKDVSESGYRRIIDTLNQAYNVNRAIAGDNLAEASLNSSNARGLFDSGINLANTTGYLPNGQQTLAGRGQEFNQGVTTAGLTGNYNGQRTLAGQELDANIDNTRFNQGIATAGITGNYNGQRTLQGQTVDSNLRTDALQQEGLGWQNKTAEWNYTNVLPKQLEELNQALKMGDAKLAQQILETKLYPSITQSQIDQNNASAYATRKNADVNEAQLGLEQSKFNYAKANGGTTKKSASEQKAELNASFGEDLKSLKNMSVKDAVNTLNSQADKLVAAYGYDGYVKLHNAALSSAIEFGQAQPLK